MDIALAIRRKKLSRDNQDGEPPSRLSRYKKSFLDDMKRSSVMSDTIIQAAAADVRQARRDREVDDHSGVRSRKPS
jgi:hypothetical protein